MSSYSVHAGTGEIFVITYAGGVVTGDESALIRHLRYVERTGDNESDTVYIKRHGSNELEEIIAGTSAMNAPRMEVDRCTEIYTVCGRFIRTVVWASSELSKAAV